MKVFVSSTYNDLIDYRDSVLSALARCETVFRGMEFFGASSGTTLDHCLSEVEMADLTICVLGTRYGSRPPGSDLSFTEHEVNHALASGRPVHAYLIDEGQPVPFKYCDVGDDAIALAKFKQRLSQEVSPCPFTTPHDLGMKIVQSLSGTKRFPRSGRDAAARYRETAYDTIADWYDEWYKDHWRNNEPFETVRKIISRHKDSSKTNLATLRVLDTACGTGNTYASFKKAGWNITGCDGSARMLEKAFENCAEESIDAGGIVVDPLLWTDAEGYDRHFKPGTFDVVVNTANSFCHIPFVPGYMDVALQIFKGLLKPGGLLIIDTKRYIQDGEIEGVPAYKELRYIAPEWVVRTVRDDPCEVPGLEKVSFHTKLHYDVDPAFSVKVPRALIVVTRYGEGLAPRTALIPYYPLPAKELEQQMREAGFTTTPYDAGVEPADKWRYDVVVGRKSTS